MVTKDEAKLIDDALAEQGPGPLPFGDEPTGNLSDEHKITTNTPAALAKQASTVAVRGFEELPTSIMTLPMIIITQPGTNVYTSDNKTPAPKGQFYLTDTQESLPEIEFVTLRAIQYEKEQEQDDGSMKMISKLKVLVVLVDRMEMYILQLPVTSFTGFGRMIAQIIKRKAINSYEFIAQGSLVSEQNKKKQLYYKGVFSIGDQVDDAMLEEMDKLARTYGGVLNRRDFDEAEVIGE